MNYMYVPEKGCAEMHAKLLTLVISGVREVRTSMFFLNLRNVFINV